MLSNLGSERVRTVASLGGRSFRSRRGLLRVEGPQAVAELLKHRHGCVRDLYFTEAAAAAHPALLQLADDPGCDDSLRSRGSGAGLAADSLQRPVRLELVSDEVARHWGSEAQGVFAVAEAAALGAQLADLSAGPGPLVLLPGTRDPGNAGTIIRNADAFGASGVVACTGTVDLAAPKVIRASAGSIFHLPVVTGVPFAEVAGQLTGEGWLLLGTSGLGEPGSFAAAAAGLVRRHAWVFGNEARGLSAREEAACDLLVRIPMSGSAESLNVAAASAVCLFASQQARLDRT